MINLNIETNNLEIILRPNMEIQSVKTKTHTSFNAGLFLPCYWTIPPFSSLTGGLSRVKNFTAVMEIVGLSLHCCYGNCWTIPSLLAGLLSFFTAEIKMS